MDTDREKRGKFRGKRWETVENPKREHGNIIRVIFDPFRVIRCGSLFLRVD